MLDMIVCKSRLGSNLVCILAANGLLAVLVFSSYTLIPVFLPGVSLPYSNPKKPTCTL